MKTTVGFVNVSCKEHKHDCYEIIFYRKGRGNFHFWDDTIPIVEGKFIIVPPKTVHSSKYNDGAETIHIKGDFNHIFSFSVPMVIMDDDEKTGEFFVNLLFENRYSNSEYLSSLSNTLAHFLMQNIRTEKSINLVIKDIVTKISDNFFDPSLSIGSFFKDSGYAEDYIRAQFKLYTGKTPVELLSEIRINHACYLIDIYGKSLTLTEIAEKCGYMDYVYFSRRFKQRMGMSPQKYLNDVLENQ